MALQEGSIQVQSRRIRRSKVQRIFHREISDDFYILFTPLSTAKVRVERNGTLVFEGKLRPGMMRLAAPGEKFQLALKSEFRHIELTIPGPSARRALRKAGYTWHRKQAFLQPLSRPSRTVAKVASALEDAAEVKERQRPLYLEGLTDSLLACLVAGQQSRQDSGRRRRKEALTDAEFAISTSFADDAMGKKLTLSRWAAALDMNSSEFTQRFRKRTNLSPYAWYMKRRIDQAKELLQEKRHSIIEVALKVGFGSQSHFTEAFRQHVGCSPARWREVGCFQHTQEKQSRQG
jgi:AraC family transcriptional regulator